MKFLLSSLVAFTLAGPSPAPPVQDRVEATRSSRYDPRSSEGLFEIHARVDGEAFIYVRGSETTHLIVSGGPVSIERSVYSQPIPEAAFGRFDFEKVDGRGSAELYEAPLLSNDYTAIIRVNDDDGGADTYHLRLNWTWNPSNPSQPPRAPDQRLGGSGGFGNAGRDSSLPGRGEFRFTGRVDHVTAVIIRGGQVRFEDFGGRRLRDGRYELDRSLPNATVDVRIVDARGRGRIEVVEQPWEGNGYTAVIRIEDSSGGDAEYTFGLEW
jgi:hypothetical protein